MFEQEYRPQQQISREAAERYAVMVAIAARKAGPSAYASSGALPPGTRVRCQARMICQRMCAEPVEVQRLPFDRLGAHAASHAAWDVGAVRGVHAVHSVSKLGTALGAGRSSSTSILQWSSRCIDQRRRRAVPKMLRTISVPAVRANCLNALEPVICSTIDFSRRCGLRDFDRAAARASRSAWA